MKKGAATQVLVVQLAAAAGTGAATLARYAAANAALPPPAPGERRVVFFGDSITDNWDAEGYGGFCPGRLYVNRGISGQTTAQMLLRFRADVIDLSPAAVVILAGTNDVAGNAGPVSDAAIHGNVRSLAELAVANGIAVVLCSILPVVDGTKDAEGRTRVWTDGRPPARIQGLNRWLREYAQANGFVYLDYAAAMADADGSLKRELTDDGLHPDAKGYAVMNPLVEAAIRKALQTPARPPGAWRLKYQCGRPPCRRCPSRPASPP
jgi:lysophospholipase L1-like esterase